MEKSSTNKSEGVALKPHLQVAHALRCIRQVSVDGRAVVEYVNTRELQNTLLCDTVFILEKGLTYTLGRPVGDSFFHRC